MVDESRPAPVPQSSTSPHHTHTPRSISVPDESETEFEPTPLHSPGGPQYEDLPPSYDFALSDARNGVASLDATQIEAHRVSANEGPNEPEVWEYCMRGETVEDEQAHEEAPAYEGHVPIQHVANSENIVVGRVQGSTSSTVGGASAPTYEDPPHSLPGVAGSNSQPDQPWSPFGAPNNGPFGAPGNGPFGAPGNGPFGGPGNTPFGAPSNGSFGRGQRSSGGRAGPGPSQDWATFGQNMGKWGEEFGRRMGSWGEQFGRQAGAMGEQIGRQAGAMGQQIGRDSSAWAAAYSGSAARASTTSAAASSSMQGSEPPRYDEPPGYQVPSGAAGQETSVLHSDRKVDTYPLEKKTQSPSEKPSAKSLEAQKANDYDDDDDSSVSSDSSDSSISSNSEDDDYGDAQTAFLKRIESINKAAESAVLQGKKSREEIEFERDLAIAKATREKESAELSYAKKQSRRTQKRDFRNSKRELTRDYRQKKRGLKEKAQSKDKGKGKAKKGEDWKELKREYKAKRRALKRERMEAKREWKRERREEKRGRKESPASISIEQKILKEKY